MSDLEIYSLSLQKQVELEISGIPIQRVAGFP
jgi:hypothetical protein